MDVKVAITSEKLSDVGLQALTQQLCTTLVQETDLNAKLAEQSARSGARGVEVDLGTIIITLKWDLNVSGDDLVISRSSRIPWMERRNRIRARVLELAQKESLTTPLVSKALEVIEIPPDQQTEESQRYNVLLDQLLREEISLLDFTHQWYTAGQQSPQQPALPGLRKLGPRHYAAIGTGIIAAILIAAAAVPGPWPFPGRTPDPTVEVPPAPTTPAPRPSVTSGPAPTDGAQPTQPPGSSMTAGIQHAPSFAPFWQPPTSFYGQPVLGGHLRVIYEDPLEHGNAWGAATGAADRFRSPTMNLIVQEDPYDAAGEIIPDLARGWTFHPDDQGVIFSFHDNIKWHDGADFTCEDARSSVAIMATGNGLTTSYMKSRLQHLDLGGLACRDNLTLNIRFKGPTATPLLALSNHRAYIFNKAWFEAGGEEAMLQDISVGTGAFRWEPGQRVGEDIQHFERNPDYFFGDGGLPYLDRLTINGIVDESAQQAAMLSRQIDWHWVRNWGQYDAYVDHDQIQTVIRPTRSSHALWINPRNPPFDNVRVRQAIFMGIDRAAAIAVLQDGHGYTGFMFPPGSEWELTEAQGCQIDGWCQPPGPSGPDDPVIDIQRMKAKRTLDQEGFDYNKTYLFTVESDYQVVVRATFIQEQLRRLGIQTDFDLVEPVAYRGQLQEGSWGDFLPRNSSLAADDPSAGLGAVLRCNSVENLWTPGTPCDENLEALLDQVDRTSDSTERKRLSDEVQLHAMSNYMWLPLFWEQEAVAFWPEVRGYIHYPAPHGSWLKYQHMWIDPSHKDDRGSRGQTTGVPGGI